MGILDVRRGKLYVPSSPIPNLDILLRGEARAFQGMWSELIA